MPRREKPKLAVLKLVSCGGCQLALLGWEEKLLALATEVEIARFDAAAREGAKGPWDIVLVEGSVSTPRDAERIHQIRRSARQLVAIGACATAGGVQALRNGRLLPSVAAAGSLPRSTPVVDHVFVDVEVRGCPVSPSQVLEVLSALLNGRRPVLPTYSLCLDCHRRGVPCVMVSGGTACLGPVTQAGCGALCPALGRGCYGCFGPAESPNTHALARRLEGSFGVDRASLVRLFRSFNPAAEAFRRESDVHEEQQ